MNFKTKPIYSLKERAIKDVKKSPLWGWIAIGFIWLVIILLLIDGNPALATSEPMQGWEDYTEDISQLHFGDKLKAQIYSLDTKWEILNLDALAYAVAVAETGNCTKGHGKTKKNCFGIMSWYNGTRYAKTYSSKQESYDDFKRIWTTYYKRFPDYNLAHKWTGGDRTASWLSNVRSVYKTALQNPAMLQL